MKESSYKEIISVVIACKNSHTIIEESSRYVYNQEHLDEFENLKLMRGNSSKKTLLNGLQK